jgi:hypothetical protein
LLDKNAKQNQSGILRTGAQFKKSGIYQINSIQEFS